MGRRCGRRGPRRSVESEDTAYAIADSRASQRASRKYEHNQARRGRWAKVGQPNEPRDDAPLCPAGHALQEVANELARICSRCSRECHIDTSVWTCSACDFDVCRLCISSSTSGVIGVNPGQDLLALVKKPEQPFANDREELPQQLALTIELAARVDENNAFEKMSPLEDWKEATSVGSGSTAPSEGFTEYSDQLQLQGDETLVGPDGELYEIFYPPPCNPQDPQDLAQEAFGDGSGAFSCEALGPAGADTRIPHVCLDDVDDRLNFSDSLMPHHATDSFGQAERQRARNQTSAEIGIAAMATFMAHSAVHTFPARAALFDTVRRAAEESLGGHFQRFSLVGSTALRIDTPDSDLDAVVFTQSRRRSKSRSEVPRPSPSQALRGIAHRLRSQHQHLRLQLVDCTRVPVLTVMTEDAILSLDLTVDEALGENHVLWFQSQYFDPSKVAAPLHSVPSPSLDGLSQGLEIAALRCVKWWLRRRGIPVPKEGGYPSIVWTLMAMHVFRCSVFVDDVADAHKPHVNPGRALLSRIAAFFDRYSDGGLSGTFRFTGCAGAEFCPQSSPCQPEEGQQALPLASFSVLDPTSEDCKASGKKPVDLAPRTSAATHLLYSYELQRAQRLSSASLEEENSDDQTFDSGSGSALLELFQDHDKSLNTLPAALPSTPVVAFVLRGRSLVIGILQCIVPRAGWTAAFLHRQDVHSNFELLPLAVDPQTGALGQQGDVEGEWFKPIDFVCMAHVGANADGQPCLDTEGLQRWLDMCALLERQDASSHSSDVK